MPSRDDVVRSLTGPGGPFELQRQVVNGVPLRVYKNAPLNLRDIWTSTAGLGDRTYLGFHDEQISYERAHVLTRRLSAFLVGSGVRKGDRVAIGMRNYPEWVIAFWAVQSVGGIVVSLNAWWTADELQYAVSDSGAVVLVVDEERFERLATAEVRLDGVTCTIVARSSRSFGEELAGHTVVNMGAIFDSSTDPDYPAIAIDPDDDSTILYTSGTTGRPKGAVGSHRNHITNITNTFFGGAVIAAMSGVEVGSTPPTAARALWTFPFFHIAGIAGITVLTTTGGAIFTQFKWDAGEALEMIERHRLTTVAGVPTVVRSLLDHPTRESRDLSSLGAISQGGAPVPPDSIATIESTFKGKVSPGNGYGLTETTSSIVTNSGNSYFSKKDSVGLPVPGADIRIVGEDGNDVPVGSVGELWVRSPNNVRGYWNKPEETARAFTDGWFHTGDAARIDGDGFVYVVDRIKDMVLRGGENVYCAEVEAVLFEHPDVGDAAVFGVPEPRLGEEVVAAVVARQGRRLDIEELRDFVGKRLATFKVPTRVFLRTEPLPRNATGKVLKKDLRDEYSS